MKRHEIQVLRRAGVTIRQIAEQAGVSPSTIKRIVREPAIQAVDDGQLTSKHGVGRPSKTEEFRAKSFDDSRAESANYDVLPDGERFIINGSAAGTDTPPLTLMLNWPEAVRGR